MPTSYTTFESRITERDYYVAKGDSRIGYSFCFVPPFGFLTNHGLVLLCIAEDPGTRMRDIASHVEITERAAQRIVADLVQAGYLGRERIGRRNRYTIRASLPISLQARRDVELNSLLNVLLPENSSAGLRAPMPVAAAAD